LLCYAVGNELQTYSFFTNWQCVAKKLADRVDLSLVNLFNGFREKNYLCTGNYYGMIEEKLAEKSCEAVLHLYGQQINPASVGIEKTKKEIEGDFTILVFPFVKHSRKSPEATASEIGNYLVGAMDELKSFTVIKGFLNLTLHDGYWIGFLNNRFNTRFGFSETRDEPPVVVEYSSPNTNKPLHLGHIRNNLLGFSLSEIFKANGHKVVRVNLVNDRGIHICKSMLAYMKQANNETPQSSGMKGDHLIGKYYVLFNDLFKREVDQLVSDGMTVEEAEKQAPVMREAQEILRRWEARDGETLRLWSRMNGWAYEGFDQTYRELGVGFDKVYYESETYLLGKELVAEGVANGVLQQRADGSVWADLRDDGLDEKLLLRSDGTSVYMTQDLGTAQLRFHDFQPSMMIYVVGNEQNYHFDVLKKVLVRLGKTYASHIFHLSYGMVELPQGKMKSREGTVVDADDLMEEMYRTAEATTRALGKVNDFSPEEAGSLFRSIGLGALKYFILKVDPKKNMLFDPIESIDFNGNTGPFIQYTHARIRSLIAKAVEAGFDVQTSPKDAGIELIRGEREVIRTLAQFPAVVTQAGKEMSPALVANYVYALARDYNQFYQEVPVLKEVDAEKVRIRLAISAMTGDIIRRGMLLLGIDVPERM
jgi:arginyl-tRNA synthetase